MHRGLLEYEKRREACLADAAISKLPINLRTYLMWYCLIVHQVVPKRCGFTPGIIYLMIIGMPNKFSFQHTAKAITQLSPIRHSYIYTRYDFIFWQQCFEYVWSPAAWALCFQQSSVRNSTRGYIWQWIAIAVCGCQRATFSFRPETYVRHYYLNLFSWRLWWYWQNSFLPT